MINEYNGACTLLKYIQLMRPKHYIKNLLIFVSLICDRNLFVLYMLFQCFIGFMAFSLLSSVVYIINDICDIEADKQHEVKRHRPLASGAIAKQNAIVFSFILLVAGFLLNEQLGGGC